MATSSRTAAKKASAKTAPAKKAPARKAPAKTASAKKVPARKAPAKKAPAKKAGSGKRELIAPNGDKRYVRRDAGGQFVESDDVGRSLAQDVRTKAKTVAKPGQGDKGDRKR